MINYDYYDDYYYLYTFIYRKNSTTVMSNDYAGTWIIIIIANIYYLCIENNINYLKSAKISHT